VVGAVGLLRVVERERLGRGCVPRRPIEVDREPRDERDQAGGGDPEQVRVFESDVER